MSLAPTRTAGTRRLAFIAAALIGFGGLSALAACQSESDISHSDLAGDAMETAPEPMPAAGMAGGDTAAIPVGDAGEAPAVGRDLIRRASLTLRADDHAEAVVRAREWTRLLGGTITDEQSRRGDTRVETSLTLRIPAPRLDTLLIVLSDLPGTLDSRSVTVEDVTRPVADTEARLAVRRAAEERLVELLADAESVEDVLAVQTRLDAVREEIESAEAILRTLRTDIAQSTVTLTVYEASAAGLDAGPGFESRIGRAFAGGWNGFLELILVIAALWPLWLIIAAVAWAGGWWRRRRAARRAARLA